MGLEGIYRLEFVNRFSGNKRIVEGKNLLTNLFFCRLLQYGSGYDANGDPLIEAQGSASYFGMLGIQALATYFFIASDSSVPNRKKVNVNQISGIFAFVQSGTWIDQRSSTPYFFSSSAQFAYPSVDRTIQTLGLSDGTSGSSLLFSILKLTPACIQQANEYLNLTYWIQDGSSSLANSGDLDPAEAGKHRFWALLSGNSNEMVFANLSSLPLPNKTTHPYRRLAYYQNNLRPPARILAEGYLGDSIVSTGMGSIIYTKEFGLFVSTPLGLYDSVGTWIQGIKIGARADSKSTNAFERIETSSKKQGLFSHSASAIGPFFDSQRLASGTGVLSFSGNWDRTFPEMFRIEIVDPGALGVATYRLMVRRHLNFVGNSWKGKPCNLIYRPYSDELPFLKCHGHKGDLFVRLNEEEIVQWDSTGITRLNVFTGVYKNFDSTTTPALACTAIKQVCTNSVCKDNSYVEVTAATKIWVACAATGLWEIETTSNSVTRISTTSCYAVDYCGAGRAIAVFQGRISFSDAPTGALNFTHTEIQATWSIVKSIKANPSSATNEVAISVGSKLVWWSTAQTAAIDGPSASSLMLENERSYDCSDWGDVWAVLDSMGGSNLFQYSKPFRLTYGTTTKTDPLPSIQASSHSLTFVGKGLLLSEYTNSDPLLRSGVNISKTGVELTDWIFRASEDSNIHDQLATSDSFYRSIYLGNRILCFGAYLTTCSDADKQNGWDIYGWNGSAWILGDTATKVTHTSAEPLIHGVNVSFTAGNGNDFTSGDFYTQDYAPGLMKDNATTVDLAVTHYLKPLRKNVPITMTITATTMSWPAAGPDFISVPVNDLKLLNLKIDGVVAILLTSGVPANGEIKVSRTDMQFHPSNINSVVSGTYSYLSHV